MAINNNGNPELVESFEIDGATISVIRPAFRIEDDLVHFGGRILKSLEAAGRTCYKSESKTTETSAYPFLEHAIEIGHFSIIEHEKVTVRLIIDRGISHEWVRHRLAAYSQESTRYVNYGKRGFQYIYPVFFEKDSPVYEEWKGAVADATRHYLKLLALGRKPQEARGVLPNSIKTELIATHNIRQWRHIFSQRGDKAAHSQFREILLPVLAEFQKFIPVLFDGFKIDWQNQVIKIKPKEEMVEMLNALEREVSREDLKEAFGDLRRELQNIVLAT